MATYVPVAGAYPQFAPPAYRLYDASAVALATFFGGPLAGTLLMAANYRKLGESSKSTFAVLLGLLGTGLILWLAMNEPNGAWLVSLVMFVCTWQLAKMLQGSAVDAHVAAGGRLGSKGLAFGMALAVLAVIFVAVCVFVYLGEAEQKVTIGKNDEVFYSGTATKAEATALGNVLKSDGYFQDKGVSVFLDKGSGGTLISFVLKDNFWNQPGTLASFEEIAREAAPTVGGLPVLVHLVDSSKTVEKISLVGGVEFGNGDEVFYEGNATQGQAQAVGQKLQSLGFFKGHGANVFLSNHDDGRMLTFVVADGAWNDPETVSDFEAIVRTLGPLAGGLPYKLDLVNTQLEVQKEETIR